MSNIADDVRENVSDWAKLASEIDSALTDAGCCETDSDLEANVRDALDHAEELVRQLQGVVAEYDDAVLRAKRAKRIKSEG